MLVSTRARTHARTRTRTHVGPFLDCAQNLCCGSGCLLIAAVLVITHSDLDYVSMYINEEGTGGELTLEQFREFLHEEEHALEALPEERRRIEEASQLASVESTKDVPPPAAAVRKPAEVRTFELEGTQDLMENPLALNRGEAAV